MRRLSVNLLLFAFIGLGCSRTVDVSPPVNEDLSTSASPENVLQDANEANPKRSEATSGPVPE